MPTAVASLLVEVAKWIAKLQFEEPLVEVLSVPQLLLLDSLHDIALDEGG